MDLSRSVDLYCERTDASFWAEPVNAISNGSFIVAALIAFLAWQRGARDGAVLLLILLVAIIGVGSFVFHTFATRGAALFDTIPIAVFIYGYLLFALRRFLQLDWLWTIGLLIGFGLVSNGLGYVVPRGALNGTWAYLPAFAVLLAIARLMPQGASRRHALMACGVLAVSLVCRTVDLALCDAWPLGSHFLWHLFNGVALYLLLQAALAARNNALQPDRLAG